MTIDLNQFHKVFIDEAHEHLGNMEQLLLALDIKNANLEELNAIFRAAHSIKGGSGTFGFSDIAELTHALETLLDKLRKQILDPTEQMVSAFLECCDLLNDMLQAHQSGNEVDESSIQTMRLRLLELADSDATSDESAFISSIESSEENEGFGFFVDEKTLPAAQEKSIKEEADGFGFFVDESELPAQKTNTVKSSTKQENAKAPAESSIRVGVEKVDQLINLVGELVITRSMLAQSASHLDPVQFEAIHEGLVNLERNSRDLQESVMSIRMLPINFVFGRFPRLVRDLTQKMNKKVRLKLVGEETELDKGLIEKLSDPLTHLLRNSIDHGIETPEVRSAAGKAEEGTITMSASHQGGSILVQIIDDGAGLNREKLLAKAREKNIPLSDNPSDKEVWQLIFAAGFSTAQQVTDVSGRGVGMDVVQKNIAEMKGQVEIESVAGQGTTIGLRLPLTLAILDGMTLRVGSEIFIMPLTRILESLQPTHDQLKTVSGQGRVVQIRGEYLPLIALYQILNLEPEVIDPEKGILVVVESSSGKVALFVDELIAQQQVVIKSLETHYRKVEGISGATIMGDGRVALILDIDKLAKMNSQVASSERTG
ncbi:chemotaxis protein CheA [Nitrincola schmidtii]|uniref:chemotaxis protein CheA n=1 Tax=Nitrincola schmidtii TaxID=1730894 RepID=UPI00124DEB98|nr:chemotaxis protein CheW [Nitrincola schmidtii]